MNMIENAVMYCKLKELDKEHFFSDYLNRMLTRREFDKIFGDEELYKKYLEKEEKNNCYQESKE